MTMNNPSNTEPSKLVIYNRDGLIEQEHFGYVVRTDKTRVLEKIGEDKTIHSIFALVQNLYKLHY